MKWVLVAVMVCATVLSDLLQSYEMKQAGEQSVSARGFARLLRMLVQRRLLILEHRVHGGFVLRVHGAGAE